MIVHKVWSVTHADRRLGLDMAGGEPSHIHLPRRRRRARPDDQDTSLMRGVYVVDADQCKPAQPISKEV